MTQQEVENEIEEIRRYFKTVGLRWTRQREIIVEQAFLTHDHFSAEGLYDMIKGRLGGDSAHLATVYRTLQVLEEGGFVEGMEVAKGEGRIFEHTLNHEHHDHVICNDCGKIVEFHSDRLEQLKRKEVLDIGFEMTSHNLRIRGDCLKLKDGGSCPNQTV
jgi:Fur family transcriptional regulator, ferric uptake regulator